MKDFMDDMKNNPVIYITLIGLCLLYAAVFYPTAFTL